MAPRRLRLAETPAALVRTAFVEAATAGELLVFPTDTVYGLAARADREASVQRIFAAKGRSAELALPVLVASLAQAQQRAAQWSPAAQALAEAGWPGPLTLVVPAAEGLAPGVTAGLGTVGLRVPDYPPLRDWLAACDFPLAVTSANLSGEPPATDPAALAAALLQHVALVLDGGPAPGGTASTVVDATSSPPRVLRPGPLPEQEIARIVGKLG